MKIRIIYIAVLTNGCENSKKEPLAIYFFRVFPGKKSIFWEKTCQILKIKTYTKRARAMHR